jgi:muramoyltetrapeptide carboxypeptidase LdcA involved in peptidoglycan recycling
MARLKEEEYMRRVAYRNLDEYQVDIGMSGTSATLVIIIQNTIYYGFVGDSLVAVSKFSSPTSEKTNDSSSSKDVDMIITKPWHTPENCHEKNRIYKHKGEVRGIKKK